MAPVPIHIVSAEAAERVDYVVCAPASIAPIFADDEYGSCMACGTRVRFRPHAPKQPPRLCMSCFAGMAEAN